MNKFLTLLLILLFFQSGSNFALQSIQEEKFTFTENDIDVDSSYIEKKAFDKNFKKKYKDTAFIYEFKTPEKNAWDRFKEWLSNILKNLFSFSSEQGSMKAVEILLKVLAVAIIVFVIFLIVKALMNKEGQWIFGKNSDKKMINYNEIEKNLHLIDFENLIQKTIQSGEKRLSIRYYYLWLLKKMSSKEIIIWDLEKTNADYLYEIKNENTKTEFAYLSYLYNYIWYGEFELDDETFAKAKLTFEKSLKSLGND